VSGHEVEWSKDHAANFDVILAFTKDHAAAQNAQITALDGKANFGLTAASLLIAAVGNLYGVDPTKQHALSFLSQVIPLLSLVSLGNLAQIASVAAFGVYLAVVFFAYQAYKVRAYQFAPSSKALVEFYATERSIVTKETIARTMAKVVTDNEKNVTAKLKWVTRVMRSLLVEAVLILVLLVLQLTVQ
jgi:hypothetical protein